MARPCHFEFGHTVTKRAAGAKLRYTSVGWIFNGWEKANSHFQT